MRMYMLLATLLVSMLLTVGCQSNAKVTAKPQMVVTSIAGAGISATWDYTKVKVIGAFPAGAKADVLALHGDYMKVVYVKNTQGETVVGYTWFNLYEPSLGKEYKGIPQNIYFMGTNRPIFICTNKVGASIMDEPRSGGRMLGAAKFQDYVEVCDVAPTWFLITYETDQGERTGWVSKKYVSVSWRTNYITNYR